MKCSGCSKNVCEGKYENRHKCRGKEERIECSCYCREDKTEVALKTVLSMEVGALAILGGFGIAVLTGGLGAAVVAGALMVEGSSLVALPILKLVDKECIRLKDSEKDFAVVRTNCTATNPGKIAQSGLSSTKVEAVIGKRMQ